jgi:hypothetical protein
MRAADRLDADRTAVTGTTAMSEARKLVTILVVDVVGYAPQRARVDSHFCAGSQKRCPRGIFRVLAVE